MPKFNELETAKRSRQFQLSLPLELLRQTQEQAWESMAKRTLSKNPFYREKFADVDLRSITLDHFDQLPFTTKSELMGAGTFAANLTHAPKQYARLHRTSGTSGRPMMVLDTAEDWQHWIESWQYVLDAADVGPKDRAVMAFSFGPFIGFWSAFDAAIARGLMVAPTGALSTAARLEMIQSIAATVIFCTPSYALQMAEVAQQIDIDLTKTAVRKIIVAGEPGGSVPAIRSKIESAWGATVIDHAGASEVGPWGFPDADNTGLFVNESMCLAEVISLKDQSVVPRSALPDCTDAKDGPLAELVLTTLNRHGCPVVRYRTGDLVRPCNYPDAGFLFLHGGVLGRTDDMMIIRGVNVFPSSIEQIIRSFPKIVEYRLTAFRSGEMDQLKIEIESSEDLVAELTEQLQIRLGLRVDVETVAANTLPRFEAKGRRFVDERQPIDRNTVE